MTEAWKMATEGDELVGQNSESAANIETHHQSSKSLNHL